LTFARLNRWDWVAFLAALVLLFVMASDWYSTVQGEEARRIERISQPQGALGGEVERQVKERAAERAEGAEKNAWQPRAAIDVLVLVALLAAIGFAVVAAFARAAKRRFEPPLTPSTAAALAAAVGGVLVAYRIVQQPGSDIGTTIKAGAPIGLALLGVIALASANALRAEEEDRAFRPVEETGQLQRSGSESSP
jgi:drug/metabolite transporter (DMT)-like permease